MVVPVVADIGEGAVPRADAGIDGADHNAFALDVGGQASSGSAFQSGLGANPLRAGIGLELALLVERDRCDRRISRDLEGLLGRQDGRQAVDGELVGEWNLDGAPDRALQELHELDLRLLEVTDVRACRRAVRLELSAWLGRRRRQAGLLAGVGRHGGVLEANEIGAGLGSGAQPEAWIRARGHPAARPRRARDRRLATPPSPSHRRCVPVRPGYRASWLPGATLVASSAAAASIVRNLLATWNPPPQEASQPSEPYWAGTALGGLTMDRAGYNERRGGGAQMRQSVRQRTDCQSQ